MLTVILSLIEVLPTSVKEELDEGIRVGLNLSYLGVSVLPTKTSIKGFLKRMHWLIEGHQGTTLVPAAKDRIKERPYDVLKM